MRAERSAHVFQRRNKPRHTKIAIIHRFWWQLCVISLQLKIFRCLYAVFTALSVQNVVHAFSSFETSPDTRNSNYSSILTTIMRNFSPVWDISSFKRPSHCIMRVERNAWLFCNVETGTHTSKSQSFVESDNNYALFLSRLRYFGRFNALFTASCVPNVVHTFSSVETSPDTRK